MTGSAHLTVPVPAYCTNGTGIHTPAQWATCARIGWDQPTTGAANAGYFSGHNIAPGLIAVLIVIALLVAVSKRRSRNLVTAK